MSTREEITIALSAQREQLEAWFRALAPEDMERLATQSEAENGSMWRPKDHLAHVLGAERYFQGVVKRALAGEEDPVGFFTQAGSMESGAVRRLINQGNERLIVKYHDEPVEALFTRLDEVRPTTLELLAGVSDEQLAQSVPHSPFGDGTVGALFARIAEHDHEHIAWLTEALK